MLLRNFIGEPYAGKLHVRFDEGAGKGFSPSRSTLLVNFFHHGLHREHGNFRNTMGILIDQITKGINIFVSCM